MPNSIKINRFFINILVKRIFDLSLFAILLTPSLLLIIFISLVLIITQGFPIFYFSKRYITPEKTITIFKFRSMHKFNNNQKFFYKKYLLKDGFSYIPLNSEMYTNIGRILEKLQLVELPQLFNVVINGMSFVGNRPLPEENILQLKKFSNWKSRFDSPCGLTGISQIIGKNNLTSKERLYFEEQYVRVFKNRFILFYDLIIIWHTILFILFKIELSKEKAKKLLNIKATQ